MKILVTGATGGIGSWTVKRLLQSEHKVVGVDLRRPTNPPAGAQFYAGDLTDQGQAWELIQNEQPNRVIHCASIPRVGERTGTETFRTNVMCTYNTLVAAGTIGADVVWTSSESIYGMPFAREPRVPAYLPIDEAHPKAPEDPYGISKLVGEQLAEMAVRRYDIGVVSLRPTWVNYPGKYDVTDIRESFDPETADRSGNFWSYIDIRDLTRLIEQVVTTDIMGHEPYLVAASNNYLGRNTAETIERVFGDLPDTCELQGDESAFSTTKAQSTFDWTPQHSWREAETATVSGPDYRH